jgi:hypothetical protein
MPKTRRWSGRLCEDRAGIDDVDSLERGAGPGLVVACVHWRGCRRSVLYDQHAALIVAAVSIGSIHCLAPDTWVPFAALGRGRNGGLRGATSLRDRALCGLWPRHGLRRARLLVSCSGKGAWLKRNLVSDSRASRAAG